MDTAIEIAKVVAALFGVLIPFFKILSGGDGEKHRRLAERHERVREFFASYDAGAHPMVVEAAFAAATGRTGISAPEIAILVRQKKPTQFTAFYSRVQDYLAPDATGSQFELKSIASMPKLRVVLVWGGLILYFALAALTAITCLFLLPDAVGRQNWRDVGLAAFNTTVFAGAAILVLIFSSRLRWAADLCESQILTANPSVQPQPDRVLPDRETASAGEAIAIARPDPKARGG
jgi:hypothetical protein